MLQNAVIANQAFYRKNVYTNVVKIRKNMSNILQTYIYNARVCGQYLEKSIFIFYLKYPNSIM